MADYTRTKDYQTTARSCFVKSLR